MLLLGRLGGDRGGRQARPPLPPAAGTRLQAPGALTPAQLPRRDPVRARRRRSPSRQAPYTPYLTTTPKQVECYPYRCPFGEGHPCCDLACADDLERVIAEVGADSVSCYIAEPIVAAAAPGPDAAARLLRADPRDLPDANDILFISDEIVTGWGRTGKDVRHRALGCRAGHDRQREGALRRLRPALDRDLLRRRSPPSSRRPTPRSCTTSPTRRIRWPPPPLSPCSGIIERDGLVENAARQGEYLLAAAPAARRDRAADRRRSRQGPAHGLRARRRPRDTAPLRPALGVTTRLHPLARERGVMIYPGRGRRRLVGDQFLDHPAADRHSRGRRSHRRPPRARTGRSPPRAPR